MRHDRPAWPSRSMIVGMYGTRVGLCAPPLASGRDGSGTHDGTLWLPLAFIHLAVLVVSHPQPAPALVPTGGLFPVNPSVLAATAYRCPNHDGEFCIENVASL